ncbi:MAG: SPOR domain-containing protein [Gammaproteobacteria bacterium]|nr:SPOR domain-containing protein [Gammaproteobacteria bacterium]
MLLTGRGGLTTGELPTNIPPKPLYEIQAPAVLPLEQKTSPEPVVEPVPETAVTAVAGDKSQSPMTSPVPDVAESQPVVSEKIESAAPVDETKTDSKATAAAETVKTETAKLETTPPAQPQQPAGTSATKVSATKASAAVKKPASASSKSPIVSGWVVQLGSFSNEKNAVKLRDTLRNNGHASFVEAYETGGKTNFRVRVGPELTRELAEQLKKQLKQETSLDGLVIAFPG